MITLFLVEKRNAVGVYGFSSNYGNRHTVGSMHYAEVKNESEKPDDQNESTLGRL